MTVYSFDPAFRSPLVYMAVEVVAFLLLIFCGQLFNLIAVALLPDAKQSSSISVIKKKIGKNNTSFIL